MESSSTFTFSQCRVLVHRNRTGSTLFHVHQVCSHRWFRYFSGMFEGYFSLVLCSWSYTIRSMDANIHPRLLNFREGPQWNISGLLTDGEGLFGPPLPKICHTYPAMMKLGTVIPYLRKTQKIYKSRDTSLEFCWHQHFFTRNQQILLHQEIQV